MVPTKTERQEPEIGMGERALSQGQHLVPFLFLFPLLEVITMGTLGLCPARDSLWSPTHAGILSPKLPPPAPPTRGRVPPPPPPPIQQFHLWPCLPSPIPPLDPTDHAQRGWL